MAKKKSNSKKTFLEKVGDKAAHLKDDIVAGKDHLVEIAGEAFDSIKSGVKNLTHKKKAAAKKKVAKKASPKKIIKKIAPKKIIKKITPKKVAKKIVPKKIAKKISVKVAPKKLAKKSAAKKSAKK